MSGYAEVRGTLQSFCDTSGALIGRVLPAPPPWEDISGRTSLLRLRSSLKVLIAWVGVPPPHICGENVSILHWRILQCYPVPPRPLLTPTVIAVAGAITGTVQPHSPASSPEMESIATVSSLARLLRSVADSEQPQTPLPCFHAKITARSGWLPDEFTSFATEIVDAKDVDASRNPKLVLWEGHTARRWRAFLTPGEAVILSGVDVAIMSVDRHPNRSAKVLRAASSSVRVFSATRGCDVTRIPPSKLIAARAKRPRGWSGSIGPAPKQRAAGGVDDDAPTRRPSPMPSTTASHRQTHEGVVRRRGADWLDIDCVTCNIRLVCSNRTAPLPYAALPGARVRVVDVIPARPWRRDDLAAASDAVNQAVSAPWDSLGLHNCVGMDLRSDVIVLTLPVDTGSVVPLPAKPLQDDSECIVRRTLCRLPWDCSYLIAPIARLLIQNRVGKSSFSRWTAGLVTALLGNESRRSVLDELMGRVGACVPWASLPESLGPLRTPSLALRQVAAGASGGTDHVRSHALHRQSTLSCTELTPPWVVVVLARLERDAATGDWCLHHLLDQEPPIGWIPCPCDTAVHRGAALQSGTGVLVWCKRCVRLPPCTLLERPLVDPWVIEGRLLPILPPRPPIDAQAVIRRRKYRVRWAGPRLRCSSAPSSSAPSDQGSHDSLEQHLRLVEETLSPVPNNILLSRRLSFRDCELDEPLLPGSVIEAVDSPGPLIEHVRIVRTPTSARAVAAAMDLDGHPALSARDAGDQPRTIRCAIYGALLECSFPDPSRVLLLLRDLQSDCSIRISVPLSALQWAAPWRLARGRVVMVFAVRRAPCECDAEWTGTEETWIWPDRGDTIQSIPPAPRPVCQRFALLQHDASPSCLQFSPWYAVAHVQHVQRVQCSTGSSVFQIEVVVTDGSAEAEMIADSCVAWAWIQLATRVSRKNVPLKDVRSVKDIADLLVGPYWYIEFGATRVRGTEVAPQTRGIGHLLGGKKRKRYTVSRVSFVSD